MSGRKNRVSKGDSPACVSGSIGLARSHYCPECPGDDRGNLIPMQARMTMPGRGIKYHCPEGHAARRGQTLLRSSPKAL